MGGPEILCAPADAPTQGERSVATVVLCQSIGLEDDLTAAHHQIAELRSQLDNDTDQ